jgi:hypothetical protein
MHFVLRGRFYPASGERGVPVRAETSLPRGKDTALLELRFPLSGAFRGEASCRLRDIFGLFSFRCGVPRERALTVRSAPAEDRDYRIDPRSGAEDRRNRYSSDEERYYMREYAPGDRFRDINWKSSERINTLITRISPDNQEKVSRIELYFRAYGPGARASLGELWLLDRAKARLAWFLRSVREEQASYVFQIHGPRGSWELKTEEDLEAFLEELAGLPFCPPQNEEPPPGAGAGELYVFSTACDRGLPAFLLAARGRPVTLFLTQPAPREGQEGEPGVLRLRAFLGEGFLPPPRWFFRGPERALGIPGEGVRRVFDYTEVRF